jgi:hypothetical protein
MRRALTFPDPVRAHVATYLQSFAVAHGAGHSSPIAAVGSTLRFTQ